MTQSETITGRFIDLVDGIRYQSLPAITKEVSKQVVLDTFAVSLAGLDETQGVGRITLEYVKEQGGAPQASVIGGGFKTSLQEAAYANGTLAHALEWDAAWHPPNQPASSTIPAIFAVAEHLRLSGAKVIEAIVASFEVQARVRLASTGLPTGEKWHKLGTTGIFGSVTAVGKLLDLDRQQMLMAFGIAGGRAGSLAVNIGTMTKSTYAGHSARMGVEAGLLAKKGWTATDDVLGEGGYFDTFMPGESKPELLLKGFAAPFHMESPGVAFKAYPSVYWTHRAIDAALELRRQHKLEPAQIERVEVRFPRIDYVNRPIPATEMDGKYSVQYTTAAALLDNGVIPDTFTDGRLQSADMRAFLPRVSLIVDETIPADLEHMHVMTDIWLADGRHVSTRVAKLSGSPGEKGLSREQQMGKLLAGTRGRISTDDTNRLIELIDRLETLPDVTEIMDILRCDSRPS